MNVIKPGVWFQIIPKKGAKSVNKTERLVNCNSTKIKEVCNGGVACSLLKLGSLEKTVIALGFLSWLCPLQVTQPTLKYGINEHARLFNSITGGPRIVQILGHQGIVLLQKSY